MAGKNYEVKATFSGDTSKFEGSVRNVLGGLDRIMSKSEAAKRSLADNLNNAGKSMMKVGGVMSAAVTAPIVGLGKVSVDSARTFDAQMNRVAAISGVTASATDKAFSAMKNQAKDLGATTIFTAEEVAQGQEMMASAGFEANEILSAMPGVMDLAAVAGGDLSLASETVANSLRQFGLGAEDSTHVADVMATVMSKSATQMDDLSLALSYAGPVANATGQDMESTAAAIGLMANTGIKGSKAGNALKNAMTQMAAPTKQAQQWMEKLDLSFTDAQGNMRPLGDIIEDLSKKTADLSEAERAAAFKALFGQQAMSAMIGVVDQGPEAFRKLEAQLRNSEGAADDMADTMMTGLPGALAELESSVDGAKIALGEALAPAIIDIADYIKDLTDKFNALEPKQQQQIAKWLGIAAAAGPALIALGLITKGLAPLAAALTRGAGGLAKFVGKLGPTGKALDKTGKTAQLSGGQFAGLGVALAGAGAGFYLASKGVSELAQSSIALAKEGPAAVAITFGLGAGIALLAKAMSKMGPELTAGAPGLVAFGAGLAAASYGMEKLSEASIKLSREGKRAIGTFVLMNGAIAGLAALFAALGPALTAGAVGMVAFGGSLALAGRGVERLANAAVKLSKGGKPAADALKLLTKHTALLAAEFAALGPILTIGSVGMLAFGRMLEKVSGGMETFVDASIKLSKAGEGATETFKTMLDSVGNLAERVKDLGLKFVASAGGFNLFGKGLKRSANAMEGFADSAIKLDGAGEGATETLEAMFDMVGDLAVQIKDLGAKFVVSAKGFQVFGDGLKKVSGGIEGFVDAAVKMDKAGEGATESMEAMLDIVGDLAERIGEMGGKFSRAAGGFEEFGSGLHLISDNIDEFAKAAERLNAAGDGAKETFDLIFDNIGQLAEVMGDIGPKFSQAADGIEAFGGSIKDVGESIGNFADAAVKLDEAGDTANQAFELITDQVVRLVDAFGELGFGTAVARKGIKSIGQAMQDISSSVESFASAAATIAEGGDQARSALKLLTDEMIRLLDHIVEIAPQSKTAGDNLQAMGSVISQTGGAMQEMADATKTMSDVGENAKPALDLMKEAIDDLANKFVEMLPELKGNKREMEAFGLMVERAGSGAKQAAEGVKLLADKLPVLSEHGQKGAENVELLSNAINDFATQTQDIGPQVEASVEQVTNLKTVAEETRTAFQQLKDYMAEMQGAFETFNSNVEAAKNKATALKDQMQILHDHTVEAKTGVMLFGTELQNLAPHVDQARESIQAARTAFTTLGNSFVQLAEKVKQATSAFTGMRTIVTSLGETVSGVQAQVNQLVPALTAIKTNARNTASALSNMAAKLNTAGNASGKLRGNAQALSNSLSNLAAKSQVVRNALANMSQSLNQAGSNAGRAMSTILSHMQRTIGPAGRAGTQIGNKFTNGMKPGLKRARTQTTQTGQAIVKAMLRIVPPAQNAGLKVGRAFANGLTRQLNNAKARARAAANAIPRILNSVSGGAYNAGYNIGNSFANGLARSLGRAQSIAAQLSATAARAVQARNTVNYSLQSAPAPTNQVQARAFSAPVLMAATPAPTNQVQARAFSAPVLMAATPGMELQSLQQRGNALTSVRGSVRDMQRSMARLGSISSRTPNVNLSGYNRPGVNRSRDDDQTSASKSKQPVELILTMGERTYRHQIDDLTEKQRQRIELTEKYV